MESEGIQQRSVSISVTLAALPFPQVNANIASLINLRRLDLSNNSITVREPNPNPVSC